MVRVLCEFCRVSCTSPRSLCGHVAGHKHRAVMSLVSPEKQEQYERVQYFVDTYLKAYPVLGLDYVMEEQVGSSYHYTCTLCNKSYGWQEMVGHVTDLDHMDLYVRRHHSEMKTTSTDLTKEEENALLMKVAQTICTEFGQRKISNGGNLDVVAVPSPIEGIKNNHPLPSTGNDLQEKGSDLKMVTQGEKCTQDSKIAKFPKYTCTHCYITCSSAVTMCHHITGSKHKKKLLSPQEHDDANRLSYFLNAHMKEDPVVGLEYVMEVKQGSLYKFSCQLCGVVDVDLMKIVSHIMDSNHIERYACKHYSHMFSPLVPGLFKTARLKAVRDISVRIVKLQGRKEIQVKNTTVGGLTESLFSGGDSKTRKAAEDTLPTTSEGDHKTKTAFEDTLPSKREGDSKTRKAFEDTLPSKREGDRKTRKVFEDTLPSKREGDRKTRKVFEDTLPSKREGDRKTRKVFEDTLPSKREGDHKTRKAFEDTLPSKHESRCSHSKWRPLSYREKGLDESHESHRYSKRPKVSKSDDPPLAKRSRLSPEGDWDALPSRPHISKHRSSHYESQAIRMDCTTAVQELEFRTNEEFFNYVSNFVISNDEDAVFIRTITQNCIRAMTNFKVEEAERQKTTYHSETPLAHTSRTAQEIPDILENKMESHSWGSKTTLLKDTSNPPSESMPKNEVTDFFFSSIKNMDESDVVGVFQKIATTNPEFQGMDIPTVIRFLKDSGRLNKP
ncbi:uncharacterized protein LOC120937842 [Rana temporaria]|uniref:uncharacterized protein LOC120937842 n=1 Tax=Rana temporaria TaxID=8407 RepID=UPI001AACCB65|nr:uncharacterized protein LOC120937842 [Rana temporaria]